MLTAGLAENAAEPNGSPQALAILRERTRELHAQLEKAVDIRAALGSRPSYVRLLRGYLSVYTPFEAAIESQQPRIQELASEIYESRIPSLEQDLLALGADPHRLRNLPSSIDLPDLSDLDSLLGALYVVEGSSLGGQIIYREIQQKLGIDASSGAAFFLWKGEQTGPAWKRFAGILNARISQPERAADSAAAMFRVFQQGLLAA